MCCFCTAADCAAGEDGDGAIKRRTCRKHALSLQSTAHFNKKILNMRCLEGVSR